MQLSGTALQLNWHSHQQAHRGPQYSNLCPEIPEVWKVVYSHLERETETETYREREAQGQQEVFN